MKRLLHIVSLFCALALTAASQTVPQVIRFTGTVSETKHHQVAGAVFAIYAQPTGGSALWQETQNIILDSQGHFTVILGAFSPEGVPSAIFKDGTARWLGISIDGAAEEKRVQLVSVPYAMKAHDADTLNGFTAAEIAAQASTLGSSNIALTSATSTSPSSALHSSTPINHATIDTTQTDFIDNTTTQVVNVVQNGTGMAVKAATGSSTNNAIVGINSSTTGSVRGVYGESSSPATSAAGVYGISKAVTGTTYGVLGITNSAGGTALNGTATSTSGGTIGLRGQVNSTSGTAVQGAAAAVTGNTTGVDGFVLSPAGVAGVFDNRAGGQILSLQHNGVEQLSVDGSGNLSTLGSLTGTTFTGDGSALTNLSPGNIGPGTAFIDISGTSGHSLNSNLLSGLGPSRYLQITPASVQLSTSTSGNSDEAALLLNMNGNTGTPSFTGQFRVDNAAGLLLKNTIGIGVIPTTGAGLRLMWYPFKAAFRFGAVDGTQWDDVNDGFYSFAGGNNSKASSFGSFAYGDGATASGTDSVALGNAETSSGTISFTEGSANVASGFGSIALGFNNDSLGQGSVTIGYRSGACADYSVALGQRATTSSVEGVSRPCGATVHSGAFVWGDDSTTTYVGAQNNNEFRIRANGGIRLRTSTAASAAPGASGNTGCDLPTGSGTWSCSSSRTIKENFNPLIGNAVLKTVRALPVSTWNYISEGSQVRHLGPVAEDFYAAFHLGPESTSIGLNDLAGVSLEAVKELDSEFTHRDDVTRKEFARLQQENSALARQNQLILAQNQKILARLQRLELQHGAKRKPAPHDSK